MDDLCSYCSRAAVYWLAMDDAASVLWPSCELHEGTTRTLRRLFVRLRRRVRVGPCDDGPDPYGGEGA